MIHQAKTPLDQRAEEYMRKVFGSPWSWTVVLDKLLQSPYDAELLRHATQCSLSHCTDSPLCSSQVQDLLLRWNGMSQLERSRVVGEVLDVQ